MNVIFHNVPAVMHAEITVLIVAAKNRMSYIDWDGLPVHYDHVNPNQCARLIGNTLVISGERCALWSEHGGLMQFILNSGLEPKNYSTSDTRLRWSDTLESFMWKVRQNFPLSTSWRRLHAQETAAIIQLVRECDAYWASEKHHDSREPLPVRAH